MHKSDLGKSGGSILDTAGGSASCGHSISDARGGCFQPSELPAAAGGRSVLMPVSDMTKSGSGPASVGLTCCGSFTVDSLQQF